MWVTRAGAGSVQVGRTEYSSTKPRPSQRLSVSKCTSMSRPELTCAGKTCEKAAQQRIIVFVSRMWERETSRERGSALGSTAQHSTTSGSHSHRTRGHLQRDSSDPERP